MAFKPPILSRNNLGLKWSPNLTDSTPKHLVAISNPSQASHEKILSPQPKDEADEDRAEADHEEDDDEDDDDELFPSYSQEQIRKAKVAETVMSVLDMPSKLNEEEARNPDDLSLKESILPSDGNQLENLVSLDYSFSDFAASCGLKTAIEATIQDDSIHGGSQSFFDEIGHQSFSEKELSLKVNLDVAPQLLSSSSLQLAKKSSVNEVTITSEGIKGPPNPSMTSSNQNMARGQTSNRKRGSKSKGDHPSKRRATKKTGLFSDGLQTQKNRTEARNRRTTKKSSQEDNKACSPVSRKSQRLAEKKEQNKRKTAGLPKRNINNEPGTQVVPSYTGEGLKFRLFKIKKLRSAGTWVECCNATCQKWRFLPNVKDPALIPEVWTCDMNPDDHHNRCDIPEEEHQKDSHVFVEANYTIGSMVWAKLQGFPWWPAFVDDDPDTERFFWTEGEDSAVVIRYHVVFFNRLDSSVTRAWIKVENVLKFGGTDDIETISNLNQSLMLNPSKSALLKARWNNALDLAMIASKLTLNKRRDKYCFMSRFKGSWSLPWELRHEAFVKEESLAVEE